MFPAIDCNCDELDWQPSFSFLSREWTVWYHAVFHDDYKHAIISNQETNQYVPRDSSKVNSQFPPKCKMFHLILVTFSARNTVSASNLFETISHICSSMSVRPLTMNYGTNPADNREKWASKREWREGKEGKTWSMLRADSSFRNSYSCFCQLHRVKCAHLEVGQLLVLQIARIFAVRPLVVEELDLTCASIFGILNQLLFGWFHNWQHQYHAEQYEFDALNHTLIIILGVIIQLIKSFVYRLVRNSWLRNTRRELQVHKTVCWKSSCGEWTIENTWMKWQQQFFMTSAALKTTFAVVVLILVVHRRREITRLVRQRCIRRSELEGNSLKITTDVCCQMQSYKDTETDINSPSRSVYRLNTDRVSSSTAQRVAVKWDLDWNHHLNSFEQQHNPSDDE